jgi:hypothetical protein
MESDDVMAADGADRMPPTLTFPLRVDTPPTANAPAVLKRFPVITPPAVIVPETFRFVSAKEGIVAVPPMVMFPEMLTLPGKDCCTVPVLSMDWVKSVVTPPPAAPPGDSSD